MHTPRKRFGQNFLQDHNIIDKIINTIYPQTKDHLIEIGPGLGALTFPILERGYSLTAIEIDRDIYQELINKTKSYPSFHLILANILEFDLASLYQDKPFKIFGNLPYNISSPLLFYLLKHKKLIQNMYFMLQKEVVERICAQPGSKNYGRLSVMMQYHCQPSYQFTVSPYCFYPKPQVESAIIRLDIPQQSDLIADNEQHFADIVQAAFQQRRKTLRNTLKHLLSIADINNAEIDANLRAEQLTLYDFIKLSNIYTAKC